MFPPFLSEITISRTSIPPRLDNAAASGVLWQAAAGRFLLEMPGVARYLVTEGTAVTIDQNPQADQETINYFLRMTPLAALLYQRGLVAFHAAAVANDQGAVLLTGDSWTGKSTLLAALLQRGWTVLADDLAAVTIDEQGRLVVLPTYSEIALWPDTLKKLGIASDSLPCCDANRYSLTLPEQFSAKTLTLRGVYCLNVHSKESVEIDRVAENMCYRAVGSFLYNSRIADVLMDRGAYLRCAASMAQSVPINNLWRPRNKWTVNALADLVAANKWKFA